MNPSIKGAIWMVGAIFAFTGMAIAARAVSFELDTFEIMMYRSFLGIVIVVAVAQATGTLSGLRFRNLRLHVSRNIAHFIGQNLWFYAVTVLPLAQVFAFEFTSPIWIVLLAPLVLGERLTLARGAAAIIGFGGILIVSRPWVAGVSLDLIAAALAALAFAVSALITRLLTRTETVVSILFFMTVLQAIFGVALAGYDGDIAWPSAASWPWLALIGCAGLLAHFCITTALSLAPASFVMPIDFARLPLIAVVGMLFYAEPLDAMVFLGGAVILIGNYISIRAETRTSKAI